MIPLVYWEKNVHFIRCKNQTYQIWLPLQSHLFASKTIKNRLDKFEERFENRLIQRNGGIDNFYQPLLQKQ